MDHRQIEKSGGAKACYFIKNKSDLKWSTPAYFEKLEISS